MRSCLKDSPLDQPSKPNALGFTMIELLLALAIGAAVITAGVMIFQSLTSAARPAGVYASVPLGATMIQNFYAENWAALDAPVAPSYGQRAMADQLRDQLWDDIAQASAVYCLGRNADQMNTTHPQTITVPATLQGQNYDSPETFRLLLASAIPSSATTFTAYRGASAARNLSIFILVPSEDATELRVQAVYDIDLVSTSSSLGSGTYVSGRRYTTGTRPTHSYNVFYLTDPNDANPPTIAFNPLVVAFERSARPSEGDSVRDRLKVAAQRPFYFIWWPDPAVQTLESPSASTFGASDPRAAYPNMGGRTSLFFTVPMFPAL